MTKPSWRAKCFSFTSFFLGIVVLVLAVSKLRNNYAGALSLQNREKRRAESEKIRFNEESENEEEGSTSWIEDYYDSVEVTTPFFYRRGQTSVQNLTGYIIFSNDELHIILKGRNLEICNHSSFF